MDAWTEASGDLDLHHLDFFALDMLGLALMIPAVLLAILITGPRPIGYVSSVAGRLRWRWLAHMAAVAFVIFIVTIGGSVALGELTDPSEVSAPHVSGRAVAAI